MQEKQHPTVVVQQPETHIPIPNEIHIADDVHETLQDELHVIQGPQAEYKNVK